MKYSKTTLMELSHKYSSILRKCALFNAAILMGAMVATVPAMAGNPNTTGNAWVFGDISLANAPVSQAAIGGRRMAWNSAGTKYKNDMPKYNMLGRSLSVTNSEMYVGPVTLTLRELTDNDVFAYNYQWDTDDDGVNDDVDMAQWAGITWDDAAGESGATNVASKVVDKIGAGNAAYTARGVYMFAQRDDSKDAGSMAFNGSTLTVNGSTVNADTISMTNSTMTVVNQNTLGLDAFDGGDIDSDGKTTLNAQTINITSSKFVVNSDSELVINDSNTTFSGYNGLSGSLTSNGGKITTSGGKITFDGNKSTDHGAGLYYKNGTSSTAVTFNSNVIFSNNEVLSSATSGSGAGVFVSGGNVSFLGNKNVFEGNKMNATVAESRKVKVGGGAIANQSYDNDKKGPALDAVMVIGNSSSTNTFTSNTSVTNGGAIMNRAMDEDGNAALTINGTTEFTSNHADINGGAIYNYQANGKNAIITFNGATIFSGNTAGGKLNDIYNAGTINFNGVVALDGGIVNTDDAVINFASGSQLKAALNNSTALISGGTTNGTTALIVENGTGNATFKLFDTQQTFKLTNALYTITDNADGSYAISKKSSAEVANELAKEGVSAQEAATISAIADTTLDHPVLNKITEAVQTGDVKTAAKAAHDLAPTDSQQVMNIAQGVNTLLNNVAGARMAALGKAGGDAFIGGSTWIQGLYNHSKQDNSTKTEGFKANTRGIAFGIDGKINEAITVGIGYGYTDTAAKAGGRKVDVDGNNIFAYAQYQPDAWYINGMFSYGFSRYKEKKAPAGYELNAKYNVHSYAANLMTGYEFESGFTPELGLRYILADQESYSDGVQRVNTDKNDVLTGVVGVKYATNIKTEDWTFKPTLRLAATYDMISDDSKANVNVIGGGNYQITGDHLNRFGVETGVGVTSSVKDWDLTLEYNGGFRKDFQSHTGMLKAKYNF